MDQFLVQSCSYSKVHHFVDDTNMLYISNSLRNINRKANYDCCQMVNKGNKISLNLGKAELILFRTGKKITKNMNFRISGQKMNIICKTKYSNLYLTNI